MKKIILIAISFILLIVPFDVYATRGGLRKATIKTCPNGITYGLHSDGNGGTHWHQAAQNEVNYYAIGEAIYSDPCPGYTGNAGTAQHTTGGSSSSGSSSSSNGGSYNSNNYNQTQQVKSNDTSLKSVKVNDYNVEISDNMKADSENKKATIFVETNDSKAKATFENKELVAGENEFDILVTAENGEQKTYKLTINKLVQNGTAYISSLKLGGTEVSFDENNEYDFSILSEGQTYSYEYRLTKYNASMKVLLNDKEIEKLENIKYDDTIKFIVLDEEDNETIYTVHVRKATASDIIITIFAYIITIFLFIVLPIIIIVKVVKKKKLAKQN